MEIDGINLVMGGTAVTALSGIAGAWIKARYGRTKVDPTPLPVEVAQRFVTCDQCQAHRDAIEKRLASGDRDFRELRGEIGAVRREISDGFVRLHERLGPVIKSVAANQEMLKQHLEDHRSKQA